MRVLYHDKKMPKLEFIGEYISDWLDVRVSDVYINEVLVPFNEDDQVPIKKADFVRIDLGFSLAVEIGMEGHVLPRSSTFKRTGLIMTNGMGIIDEAYCGDGDKWMMPFYATRDTVLIRHERIGQFKQVPKMGQMKIIEVETLGAVNRGGHGSTGII